MTWREYHRQALAGIEETEQAVDDSWDESWLLLLLLMGGVRSRLGSRAARLDLTDRRAVMRFRSEVKREAAAFIRDAERGILGRSSDRSADPTAPRGRPGIQSRTIHETLRRTTSTWSEMRTTAAEASRSLVDDLLAEERRRRITVDPGSDARGPVESPLDLLEGPREIAEEAQAQAVAMAAPRTQATREALAEDEDDVAGEAELNPRRHVRFEAERLVESVVGLTSRHGRRAS